MANTNKIRFLMGVVVAGLLVGGCAKTDTGKLEGNWECTTLWSWDKNGESVPCSAKQQASCLKTVLSSTGVISLGDAQWTEAPHPYRATWAGEAVAQQCDGYDMVILRQSPPKGEIIDKFQTERALL